MGAFNLIGAVENEYGYRREASGSTPRQGAMRIVPAALKILEAPIYSIQHDKGMKCRALPLVVAGGKRRFAVVYYH
jgi:hypothetical protein